MRINVCKMSCQIDKIPCSAISISLLPNAACLMFLTQKSLNPEDEIYKKHRHTRGWGITTTKFGKKSKCFHPCHIQGLANTKYIPHLHNQTATEVNVQCAWSRWLWDRFYLTKIINAWEAMNSFIGKFYDTTAKWHWSWQITLYATRIIAKMGGFNKHNRNSQSPL